MHWISGSGLPDVRPSLISSSSSKLSDSKPDSLLIYCMLFCNLSDFHCISTLNIQYTHSVFEFNHRVCVCGDLSLCACKVTWNYLHIIRCRNTVIENLGNEL